MKFSVTDLKKGMFVQDLDRPWIDSPFLLQGFLIESDEELAQLRALCKFVVVDAERSLADLGLRQLEAKLSPSPAARAQAAPRIVVHADQGGNAATPTRKGGSILGDLGTIVRETFAHQGEAAADSSGDRESLTIHREAARPGKRAAIAERAKNAREPAGEAPAVVIRRDEPDKPGLLRGLFGRKRPTAETVEEEPSAKRAAEMMSVVTVDNNKIVPSRELVEARRARDQVRDAIKGAVLDIQRERKVELEKVQEAVDQMVESVSKSPDALMWLTKLKTRDSYAYDHGIDVSIYMLAFARHLGYPREQMQMLGLAGLMLDVGKLRMPVELLEKPTRLSDAEFKVLQRHVDESISILRDTSNVPGELPIIVAQHHERFDGSGYPKGLGAEQISQFGGMAGIVDCFEAITSERPYASALSTHQALQNLNSWKGRLFHEGLVEQFMQCVGIFPVGSLVELNTGDVGIVIAQNKVRRLRPRVMVVLDPDKKPYGFPMMLDLMHDPTAPNGAVYAIRKDLPPGMYGINAREYYL